MITSSLCPFDKPCFVVDVNLGKLARYLRLLGFDALYRNDDSDSDIVTLAAEQQRFVLTRDVDLLKHKRITYGYWVRHTEPRQQLREVITQLQLHHQIQPFQRCLRCNGVIVEVDKQAIEQHLLPKTKAYFQQFYQCQHCLKIYWRGSHYENILQWVHNELLNK